MSFGTTALEEVTSFWRALATDFPALDKSAFTLLSFGLEATDLADEIKVDNSTCKA